MTVQPITNDIDDMIAKPYVAPKQESNFFGQVVTIDPSAWKWQDRKLVAFDATYDRPDDRVRGISIIIECEKQTGGKFTIDTGSRPLLESDLSWHGHTLPSLQRLGVPLSQLKGKFVQVRRIDTKKTYTASDGTTKARQALEFVATFEDWHAMHAARQQLFKRDGEQSAQSAPPAAAPAPIPAIDKSALEKLLPALWQAAQRDQAVFTTMFNGNPSLTAAFTLTEAIEIASLPF
mgnify:CR=1 FL=1